MFKRSFGSRVLATAIVAGAFAVGGAAAGGSAFAAQSDTPGGLKQKGYSCTKDYGMGIVACSKKDEKPQLCNTDNNKCVVMDQKPPAHRVPRGPEAGRLTPRA